MTHPHDPTGSPSTGTAEQYVLVAAGAVIVALTIASFWLSYAHLAEVAGQHGLGGSVTRQWAWPGTVDAFIVTGELLMLRAGLKRVTDGWAIGLTITGSMGSIALNVAGVHGSTDAPVPLLDYIVAAVPPTAALLAFGVLMRQIHQLVAPRSQRDEPPAPTSAPGTEVAAEGDQDSPQQSTAGTTEVGTAGPRESNDFAAASPVPYPEPDAGVSGPHGQEAGTGSRTVPAGDGPRTDASAGTTAAQEAPEPPHRGTNPKPLVRGDRPQHEHATPGAGLEQPLPHPASEDCPDDGGDREPNGDRPDTDGDQEPNGDRPDTDGDQEPNGDRPDTDGDQEPNGDRPDTDGDQEPNGDRPDTDGDQEPNGDRPDTDGDQEPNGDRPDTDGDQEPNGDRPDTDGDQEPNGDRPDTDGDQEPNGDRPDTDGDQEPNGDRPDTDGDQEPNGDRPDTDGDQEPSAGPKGRRPRAPRLTEDEIVELVRPHLTGVLKRDGNEAVTRVQLRGIMREHKIPIRNDRLTPVLARLRTPQPTPVRSAR